METARAPQAGFSRILREQRRALLKELGPFSFAVFLELTIEAWDWRAEIKNYGDGTVRASAPFVSVLTGISTSKVKEIILDLTKRCYLRQIKQSFKEGNTYFVEPFLWSKKQTPTEPAPTEPAPMEPTPAKTASSTHWSPLAVSNGDGSLDLDHQELSLPREWLEAMPGGERERTLRVYEELKAASGDDPAVDDFPKHAIAFGEITGAPIREWLYMAEKHGTVLLAHWRKNRKIPGKPEPAAAPSVDIGAVKKTEAALLERWLERFTDEEAQSDAYERFCPAGMNPEGEAGRIAARAAWRAELTAREG